MTEQNGVERSTATEIFRAMLDERDVEWEDGGEGLTIIPAQDGVPQAWTVNTWPSGKDMGDCLWVQNRHPLTPEQAVAATLGQGTCCILFAGWEPIEGGDEYELVSADVEPDGFCKWGARREDA